MHLFSFFCPPKAPSAEQVTAECTAAEQVTAECTAAEQVTAESTAAECTETGALDCTAEYGSPHLFGDDLCWVV
jgi:hypothetical protein